MCVEGGGMLIIVLSLDKIWPVPDKPYGFCGH